MRLLILALAALPVLGAGPARAARILDPVPWIQAGVDPLLGSSFVLPQIHVNCRRETPGICASGAHDLVLGDRITFSDGEVSFQADFVSEVSGKIWTYGLANLEFSAPSDLFSFRAGALFTAGSFKVPFDGTNPTTRVAIRVTPSVDFALAESALFGFFSILEPGAPHHFVATETLTIRPWRLPIPFWSYVSHSTFSSSACLGQPGSIADDCLVSVELLQVSVPESATGGLLGLGLLLLLRGRRGRERRTRDGTAGNRARMPGALLAVALGVGGAGPAAAASVVLEPVPWSEAGVDTSQPGAPLQLEVICSAEVPGTCVSGVHGFPVQDRISFSDGEVVFEADFVSKVSGNLWAYGLRNLALSVPDEIVHFAVERFDVFAAFQVPSDGADRRVPLVMRATPAMSFIEGQSAADGPVLLRNFGTVELFEPADEITVFDEGFWSSGRG